MARKRRKPMSDINVVPYIDVMLVLLVIFMISTPLLTQGVKVELPRAETETLDVKPTETLVVKVDINGNYYLAVGTQKEVAVEREVLVARVEAQRALKPKLLVLVAGDKEVRYIYIMDVLALLNQAGIPNVGLMTKSLEDQQ